MPDGRSYKHAHKQTRTAALTLTALTSVGFGLATASPATAASETNNIDQAQSRVDRLTAQAATADKRHNAAQASYTDAREQLQRLQVDYLRQRRIVAELQTTLASTAIDQYDASGGSSVQPAPLGKDSRVLLSSVTLVSQDTYGQGQAMARSNEQIQLLAARLPGARTQVSNLAAVERGLRSQERTADSRATQATSVLRNLQQAKAAAEARVRARAEAQRVAQQGGPAVAFAKAQVGKSYVFGAAGPDSFDCSGLTMMAWQQAGVSLPHNSSAQYASSPHISESELKPGDLVFYYSPISHVGIYIGNGQIVNALNPGSGVKISGLHDMPYSGAVRPG